MSNENRIAAQSSRRCCKLVTLQRIVDARGSLTVAQLSSGLPFVARRFFFVGDVPEGCVRGHHGRGSSEEFLVAVRGRVLVELQGRGRRRRVMLDRSTVGLHLTPGVYSTQQFFDGALLLVLASDDYDPSDNVADPLQATGDIGDE